MTGDGFLLNSANLEYVRAMSGRVLIAAYNKDPIFC
jgi:hypothetical protein